MTCGFESHLWYSRRKTAPGNLLGAVFCWRINLEPLVKKPPRLKSTWPHVVVIAELVEAFAGLADVLLLLGQFKNGQDAALFVVDNAPAQEFIE